MIPTAARPLPRLTQPLHLIGPAVILVGMSQGSGELWLVPKLHVDHGLDFSWIILWGTLFQLPILVEGMRTVALTGEGPLEILSRLSRPAAVLALALTVFALIGAAGFIMTVGESVWRLVDWPDASGDTPKRIWATILAIAFAVPTLYRRTNVQKYMEVVVGCCSAVAIALFLGAVILRRDVVDLPEFLSALLIPRNFGGGLATTELTTLVVGFTYMGLGGWYCLFYPLWGQNRRIGMAGAAPAEPAMLVADGSDENRRNLRKWLRSIWLATAAALSANAITVMLTSVLALGLLRGTGAKVGSNWDIAIQQAKFFEPTLGNLASIVFLIAVIAFFSDTWLGTYVSLAQLLTVTWRRIAPGTVVNPERAFRIAFVVVFLISLAPVLSTAFSPGTLLLKWTGVTMFCSMPIISSMLLVLNYVVLPKSGPTFYRPSPVALAAMVISTLVYTGATLLYVHSAL